MRAVTPDEVRRWAKTSAIAITAVATVISIAVVLLWRDRASLDEIDWPPYPNIAPSIDADVFRLLGHRSDGEIMKGF